MDHYNKDLDNKISLSSRISYLPVFIIIYKNSGKEKDKDDDDQDKRK